MQVLPVFFYCTLVFFCVVNLSLGMPHTSNMSLAVEDTTDELLLNLQPFNIILEHHLRTLKTSKRTNSLQNKSQISDINFKSIEKTSGDSGKNICSEMELRKKASAEEISEIFNGDVNFEEDEARLQKIYDSFKDCQFVKIRSSKLWGPLWHCLNRLFLFFVFG